MNAGADIPGGAMRTSKQVRRPWLWFMLCFVVLSVIWQLGKEFSDYRIQRQVDQWTALAQSEAGPEISQDDAVRWLRDQEFECRLRGEGYHGGPNRLREDYLSVSGTRSLDCWKWISKPFWVEVTFEFTTQDKFQKIRSCTWQRDPCHSYFEK